MSRKKPKTIQLILSIAVCQLAGIIGSFFTSSSVDSWYSQLEKPWFNPPNWMFGPVWLLLYTLMGIALYLIYQKRKKKLAKFALGLFFIHLAINASWSIVFFGMQEIFASFVMIIILWVMIVYLIMLFLKINKHAAWLFLPYLLWVSFAAVLNASLYFLNF